MHMCWTFENSSENHFKQTKKKQRPLMLFMIQALGWIEGAYSAIVRSSIHRVMDFQLEDLGAGHCLLYAHRFSPSCPVCM